MGVELLNCVTNHPMKPFTMIYDADGRYVTLEFETENRRVGEERVLYLSGQVKLKDGSPVTVKAVRANKWPFLGRHVRVTGNTVTTPQEIANQLNKLFAEE